MGPKRKRTRTNNGRASAPCSQQDSRNPQPYRPEPETSANSSVPSGRYPELLTSDGDLRLRIGVDFGTANTCASFVVLSATEDGIFDYVKNIEALHARNEQIRFPTVMAVVPTRRKPGHATIAFATDAIDALADGKIKRDHMFEYPKLGLISDLDAIVSKDHLVLRSIQSRHDTALNIVKSFREVTVKYPGKEEQVVAMNTIDDVIVACLRYFLCLSRVSLAEKLEVTDRQLDRIFEHKTEVGFAAPAFWSDAMLDRFLHQIQAAGWPSHCRIWSEPKCALAAHISLKLATVSPSRRGEQWKQGIKAVVMVDVGSGTTDLASIKPKRMDDKTIEFESIVESSGSLCGGRLLDFNIETYLRLVLDHDLQSIREFVSDKPQDPIGEEDFFQGFDFDECRKNFDNSKDEYSLRYRGNNLPSARFEYMTAKAITLSRKHMVAAHEAHARRVIEHIEEQIAKTREALINTEDLDIEVLLVGGVTRSPFFSRMVQTRSEDWDSVRFSGSVENFQKPLVAIGCILCLGQPAIGRRFRVKEAYGIPIAKEFDPLIHSQASQAAREDATRGQDARDLIDWLRCIDEFSEKKVEEYNWSVTLYNDDDSPYTDDPRQDPSLYPLVIKQEIFSTTNRFWGRKQHFEYKDVPDIKLRKICEISLSRQQCLQISDQYDRVGFYQHPRTRQWSFLVPVRITLQWLDVRASWTAEIPQSGRFTNEEDQPVWSKEIRFATVEHHGHKVGDENVETA